MASLWEAFGPCSLMPARSKQRGGCGGPPCPASARAWAGIPLLAPPFPEDDAPAPKGAVTVGLGLGRQRKLHN